MITDAQRDKILDHVNAVFNEGYEAYRRGDGHASNPYVIRGIPTAEAFGWYAGWRQAQLNGVQQDDPNAFYTEKRET